MNTQFTDNDAILVTTSGIELTFCGCGTSGEREDIVLDNIHIGRVTRAKINKAVADEKCESVREVLKVVLRFAKGDERAIQKIKRAAGCYDD